MRALYTLVIMIAVCFCSAALGQADIRPRLTVVKSVDAPGELMPDRLSNCMNAVARELSVDVKALPLILVLHVSKEAAKAAGLKESAVRHNNSNLRSEDAYYEMWIVGEPRVAEYLVGIENIFEHHFKLKISDIERKQVLKHVLAELTATVDVQDLGK